MGANGNEVISWRLWFYNNFEKYEARGFERARDPQDSPSEIVKLKSHANGGNGPLAVHWIETYPKSLASPHRVHHNLLT